MVERATCYPVDSSGFVRQCAWCRQVADECGSYSLSAPALLLRNDVSHGCCTHCRGRLQAEAERHLGQSGVLVAP